MADQKKLVWLPSYSVGVEIIDQQHQLLFGAINNLIDAINTSPTEEKLVGIMTDILTYKKNHFATEEKFFHEFNYEGTTEHEAAHKQFGEKIEQLQKEHGGDAIDMAFYLVDYLEDWLIGHLLKMDQKYVKCFHDHGLK